MDNIEKLPVKILKDGKEFYLRIKARDNLNNNGNIQKWCIKYVGKYHDEKKEKYSLKARVQGFSYKTACSFWGITLESAAKKALQQIEKREDLFTS